MCEEYCGTEEVEVVGLAQEASEKAARAMGAPQCAPLLADVPSEEYYALMSEQSPAPVRVVRQATVHSLAGEARVELPSGRMYDVNGHLAFDPAWPPADRTERVTRRLRSFTRPDGTGVTVQRNNVPVLAGTPLEKLLRLCEELLETDHPDVDTQWYHKRLQEIKAEINGAGAATEA
jgi:hypothetical protein